MPWFALKSSKSWLCKPRDSNCSMKGTMSSHLHMSQESQFAIESMRRTLHFCWALEGTWLKLSRGSLNSLLPQHHDFFNDLCSTLPNQTKNSKPNGRSKPRRCKGSPASSAPILDEHLLKRMRILNDVAEIDKTTILYPLFCI